MRIRFTRLTGERHRFEVERDDGTSERVELETRSLLLHDLVHYVVEMEVPFARGFYGLLATGTTLAELVDRTRPWPAGTEIARAEALVGPLQSMLKGRFEPRAAREKLQAFWSGETPSLELLTRIGARFRSVWGRARATPFGHALELEWPEASSQTRR